MQVLTNQSVTTEKFSLCALLRFTSLRQNCNDIYHEKEDELFFIFQVQETQIF